MNIPTSKYNIVIGDIFHRVDYHGNRFIAIVTNVTDMHVDVKKYSPYTSYTSTERAQLHERYEQAPTGNVIKGILCDYPETVATPTGEVHFTYRWHCFGRQVLQTLEVILIVNKCITTVEKCYFSVI